MNTPRRNSDHTIARMIAAILGREGERKAWYRVLEQRKKMPATVPFVTSSSREMAYSVFQRFTTANICPTDLDFSNSPSLDLTSKPTSRKDQYLSGYRKTTNSYQLSTSTNASEHCSRSPLTCYMVFLLHQLWSGAIRCVVYKRYTIRLTLVLH